VGPGVTDGCYLSPAESDGPLPVDMRAEAQQGDSGVDVVPPEIDSGPRHDTQSDLTELEDGPMGDVSKGDVVAPPLDMAPLGRKEAPYLRDIPCGLLFFYLG